MLQSRFASDFSRRGRIRKKPVPEGPSENHGFTASRCVLSGTGFLKRSRGAARGLL